MKKLTALLCLTVFSLTIIAQQSESIDLQEASLEEHYNNLYRQSNNYQDYKVIKKTKINNFWKNVSDTLEVLHDRIAANNSKLIEQANEIDALNTADGELKANIASLTEEKDGIAFFGSIWTKQKYKTTMWSLVFILLATLAFMIIRFLASNQITRSTKRKLSEVESEFDAYRKTAILREQEIKRELQNYINKVSDLTGGS